MTRREKIVKQANEICNDPNNDYKSTLDLCIMMGEWADEHPKSLWKDAQGDDLPPIDKEVIVIDKMGKVSFGHRPVESFTAVSLTNHSEMEEYFPERYDKGGWNIPDVKWWLDLDLPNLEE